MRLDLPREHHQAVLHRQRDNFPDSVVFAAFIDRVGKYQLTMQKVSSYRPYATSMPPMLKEEAFHLAAGVVPPPRRVGRAGGARRRARRDGRDPEELYEVVLPGARDVRRRPPRLARGRGVR